MFHHHVNSGTLLKRELTSVTNLALELPAKNNLRVTLQTYKTRIEEYLDEFLGSFVCCCNFCV